MENQNLIELFDTSTDNVGLHLKNIYKEKELDENSTTENFSVVRQEGNRKVKRNIKHYNLDAIISVGYRVSSYKATKFRQWATYADTQDLINDFGYKPDTKLSDGIKEFVKWYKGFYSK